jgi:hypothetical protein
MNRTRKPDAKRDTLPGMRIRAADGAMIRKLAADRGQSLADLFVALAKPHALPENTQNQPLTQNNGQTAESHG